jgi:hypothetical protein
LLSFNGDTDAEDFCEWFAKFGLAAFAKWQAEEPERISSLKP